MTRQKKQSELKRRLSKLPIEDFEVVASDASNTEFLILGFVADEQTRLEVAKAISATGASVHNQIVCEASRKSGRAPSSFDGHRAASPSRKKVRALLNRSSGLAANNDYKQALTSCLEAQALAEASFEPALVALTLYATACYTLEAPFFSQPRTILLPIVKRAYELLGSEEADPILYSRVTQTLQALENEST